MYSVALVGNNEYEVSISTISGGEVSVLPFVEDNFSLSADTLTFTLSESSVINSVKLFINGIKQQSNSFSVTGNTLTVTGFTPASGDIVSITYQRVS